MSDNEETSGCFGKVAFDNYTIAAKALKRKKDVIRGRRVKIYLCDFCKKFHLGGSCDR